MIEPVDRAPAANEAPLGVGPGGADGTGRVVVTGGRLAYPLRDFLERNGVDFRYLDKSDSQDAMCVLPDGTRLRSPSVVDLARALGMHRPPRLDTYDLVIVGAGPAGLAAAVSASSEGLSTAVVEREAFGGQAGTSSLIENYLGFPDGISGAELAGRARAQAQRLGAELLLAHEVTSGGDRDGLFVSHMADGEQLAGRTVLVATGVDWRRLDVPGIDRLLHAGVYYGAASSEAPGTRGKDVFVVGAGNSAGQAAVNFSGFARSVTLLVRGQDPAASMSSYLLDRLRATSNVVILTGVSLTSVAGDDWLREITYHHKERGTVSVAAHAMFLCIGGEPRTQWATGENLARDPAGYLLTGADLPRPLADLGWPLTRDPYPLETNRPGLFVAGDVRHGSTKRMAAAVGEGAQVIQAVHRHLADLGRTNASPGIVGRANAH